MFKKNSNRPPIVVSLKKTPTGYRIINNESHQLFVIKRVTRTMYRRKKIVIQLILFKPPIWEWTPKVFLMHLFQAR